MKTPQVAVVGAGIAGLAAAHALRQATPNVDVTVFDSAKQVGGKLRSSDIAGTRIDEGADAVVARTPEAVGLIREVGLSDDLTSPATSSAMVAIGQSRYPLPTGTLLGVPADIEALRISGLLDTASLRQIAEEPDRPGELLVDDVIVGSLLQHRLGPAVVDRLVDPLLGGVYAGRADLLSLQATMPQLAAELTQHPSVVRGVRKVLAAGQGKTGPVFATVKSSLGALPATLVKSDNLTVHCGRPIREIHRAAQGFQLVSGAPSQPTIFNADAVIVAVPAGKAALMLQSITPWAASELAGIDYASVVIVTLAYQGIDLPAGSGMLVPATTGKAVKAITFSSQKWAHLADPQRVMMRVSLGRYGDARVLQRDDNDIVHLVQSELGELLGITTPPIETRVTRWGGALPQYALGHRARVQRIHADIARQQGIAVCGAWSDGVGIAACVRSGQQAARTIIDHINRTPSQAH